MRRLIAVLAVAALVEVPMAAAWTWPVDGPVLRAFVFGADPYAAGQHRGIDIGAPPGAPVRAATGGTVSFAGTVPSSGNTVTVRTADGLSVTYLELGSIGIARGADVSEGEQIGAIGAASHVHFGVRVSADPQGYLDPLLFLPARAAAPTVDPASAEVVAPSPPRPTDDTPSASVAAPESTDAPADGVATGQPVVELAPAEPVSAEPDPTPDPRAEATPPTAETAAPEAADPTVTDEEATRAASSESLVEVGPAVLNGTGGVDEPQGPAQPGSADPELAQPKAPAPAEAVLEVRIATESSVASSSSALGSRGSEAQPNAVASRTAPSAGEQRQPEPGVVTTAGEPAPSLAHEPVVAEQSVERLPVAGRLDLTASPWAAVTASARAAEPASAQPSSGRRRREPHPAVEPPVRSSGGTLPQREAWMLAAPKAPEASPGASLGRPLVRPVPETPPAGLPARSPSRGPTVTAETGDLPPAEVVVLVAAALAAAASAAAARCRRRRDASRPVLPTPACPLGRMRAPRLVHACARQTNVDWLLPVMASRPLAPPHRPLPRARRRVLARTSG